MRGRGFCLLPPASSMWQLAHPCFLAWLRLLSDSMALYIERQYGLMGEWAADVPSRLAADVETCGGLPLGHLVPGCPLHRPRGAHQERLPNNLFSSLRG